MDYRIEAFLNSINSCTDVVRRQKKFDFSFLCEYMLGICVIIYGSISLYIFLFMLHSKTLINSKLVQLVALEMFLYP